MRADEVLEELGDLHERLAAVVKGLSPEQLDRVPAEGANSIAVLITHTLGSNTDWLSRAAGRTISRDRDSEFLARQRTADDLVAAIESAGRAATELVTTALAAGENTERTGSGGKPRTIAYCIAHVLKHASEHLGHAEVTRQVVAPGG
jgi:uncharacterized damage-inducible protein DinB